MRMCNKYCYSVAFYSTGYYYYYKMGKGYVCVLYKTMYREIDMVDMELLYTRNGVHIANDNERHYRRGWLNTPCPFCQGNEGNHLGWNILQQYFVCIRCGWKPTDKALNALIDNPAAIKDVLAEYKVNTVHIKEKDKKAYATKCTLPPNIGKLGTKARKYLNSRNFDAREIAYLWGLSSTDNIECTKAGFPEYKNRIIAPIYNKGRLVSYQTRDTTNKARLRYLTAPMTAEVVHHKHVLYGADQVPTDSVVVVEGITDVWRLGFGAVATLGIKYTPYQLLALSKYKNRFILFDTKDPQARKQGMKLAKELSVFNGHTEYIEITGKYRERDPAEFSQKYANDLMSALK